MTPLQRLKAKKAEAKQEAVQPAEVPSPEPKPKKAPKQETGTQVTYTCGHKESVKNLEGMLCRGCRQVAVAKKNRERFEKRAAMVKDYPQRLPDGAEFRGVVYSAERQEWRGELWIGEQCFSGTSSGVMRLLQQLDAQYRKAILPNCS